ncbi:MAG: LapA family protein [Pseudomonadota bacterium]|nr:LapA family protein [Pseudomonadota bacterium]
MQARTILLLLVFGALGVFAALNWAAFMTPTSLSLVFASVKAPLGLILLGVIAVLSALFLAFAAYLQAAALLDARRHARAIEAQRQLADSAEASRFTELQAQLRAEMEKLKQQHDEALGKILARIDSIDRDFRGALERTESAIAAYVGELDDSIGRGSPAAPK